MEGLVTGLRRRIELAVTPSLRETVRVVVIRSARPMLLVSLAAVSLAQLLAGDTYSFVEHTVSEAGGQGVDGGWLFRGGVVLASATVFALSYAASPYWPRYGSLGIRLYSVFLLGVAAFSDLPWYANSGDEIESFLHTFSSFWAGFGFIVGIAAISVDRPATTNRWVRLFDRLIILAVILIPMVMLAVSQDGLLQRLLILMGYGWLIMEATRVSRAAGVRA